MRFSMMGRDRVADVQRDAAFARKHGFVALEYNFWDGIERLTLGNLRQMKRVLSDHGIAVSMVGLWNRNHISTDAAEAAAAHGWLARAIDYAEELGAGIFVTGGGERPGAPLPEQIDAFCAFYPPYLKRIQDAGMTPALYAMHCCSFLHSPEAYEQLWQRIPEPGVKFDPANWHAAGMDYLAVMHRLGPRIVHMHIKEHYHLGNTNIGEAAAGMGEIAWGKVMALLYHHDYRGYLAIEPHGPYSPKADEARATERVYQLSKRHIESFLVD